MGLVDDGKTFSSAAIFDDVRGVAAAGALGVVGVDGPARNGGDGVLDKAGLVQGVGVDGYRHVVTVGHLQAAVNGRWRGAPVLVQLQAAGPGLQLFLQGRGDAGVALAQQSPVDRQVFRGLQHPRDVPGAGSAGGGVGAVRRAGAAANHSGNAVGQSVPNLLRRNHMYVGVNAPRRGDEMLAGDDLGAGPYHHVRVYPVHYAGVAGLADGYDVAGLDADVALDDAQNRVHDDGIGNHQVQGAAPVGGFRGLAHAVPCRLAATKDQFVAVGEQVAFHLADQRRVGQAEAVAHGGAVQFHVLLPADARHANSPPECRNSRRTGGQNLPLQAQQGLGTPRRRVQVAVYQPVQAMNPAGSAHCHQGYVLAVAGFKAHGGAGGNVQPHAVGRRPVKAQGAVGLKEMKVGTNLYGPVAGIPHGKGCGGPPRVDSTGSSDGM